MRTAVIKVRNLGQAFACDAVVIADGEKVHETDAFPHGRRHLAYERAADWADANGYLVVEAAVIRALGNGLADVGDYVAGADGEVYRVVRLIGPIHTGRRPGDGDYQHAEVAHADWADVDDDNEPACSCTLEGA